MFALNADESRVLGVLIEKATTTPEQYPLSLNAVTNGSNQKSNRWPVRTLSEDQCFEALEALRTKGLVVRVDTHGSRVPKYRHNAGDVLHARAGELALLAELLLRGPQAVGELRGRAGRMAPIDSSEAAQGLLSALMTRDEPLVKEIPPSPGSRANRFVQLLCDGLHPLEASPAGSPMAGESQDHPSMSERVSKLENEIAQLREVVQRLTGKTP